jgi:leader peptidase (prepilin peptidase)/N-methyltransferase
LIANLVYALKPSLFIAPSPHGLLLDVMIFNAPWRFSLFDRFSGAAFGLLVLVAINVLATFILRQMGRLDRRQWAMGFGDAVLLSAIGLFVGARHLLALLFLASLVGSIIGLATRFEKKAAMDQEIAEGALPYGPFLAIAAIYVYLF